MKTELEVAKGFLKNKDGYIICTKDECLQHKATCERWLECWERDMHQVVEFHTCGACDTTVAKDIKKKFKDLRATIKLYNDALCVEKEQ